MKKTLFIKPDLSFFFTRMPAIGMFLRHDYKQAKSIEDLAKLFHKWLTISETTTNATKERCYQAGAYYLYSFLTNKSYESKLNIEQ